ncbi:EpsG family protein [Flavobacterium oreochromis]|uniref:EpsG family protein n=1 Tax=Flavobacterium oreochromis TaxID=2906078 RepID=UPI00385C4694
MLCVYEWFTNQKYSKFVYIVWSVFLICIVGLREIGVDNDSKMYLQIFKYYKTHSIYEYDVKYIEKAYVFLNVLVAQLSPDNALFVFFIMAFFTGVSNYCYFYKKTDLKFFSILFYLSFFLIYRDFSQIRYALACSLCYWAIYFFINEKIKLSLGFLILGGLFHNTIFLFVPIIITIKYVDLKKYFYYLMPICFFVGIYFNVLNMLLSLFASESKIAKFYYQTDGGGSNSITIIGILILLFYHKFVDNNTVEENFYSKLVMVSVLLNLFFIQSSISQRLIFLFFQFSIPLFSYCIKKYEYNRKIQTLIYLLFVLFLSLYGCNMIKEDLLRPYEMNSFVTDFFTI